MVSVDNSGVVEDFYLKNEEFFKDYCKIFDLHLQVPTLILEDTIKRLLVDPLTSKNKKKYLLRKYTTIDGIILLISAVYLGFMSLFGLSKKRHDHVDLLFEDWGADSAYKDFYKGIHHYLLDKNIKIFATAVSSNKAEAKYLIKTVRVRNRFFNSKTTSRKLFLLNFRCFFKILKLSKASNFSFSKMTVLLYRYILIYNTDLLNISANALVSAADNHYNALRYHIYKKNGIDSIFLLQNGYRDGKYANQSGETYTYCDYYFGFGIKQIEIQSKMQCSNKISVGSIKLYNSVVNLMPRKIDYDVLFIDGYAGYDDYSFNTKTYKKIIDNLIKFKKDSLNLTVAFRIKPSETKVKDLYIIKRNKRLIDAGIVLDTDCDKNTYEAIIRSNLILFYRTTAGLEAIGMGKKTIQCNYDGLKYYYSHVEDIGCLVNSDYKNFQSKINGLLESDTQETNDYYNKLKNEYMNQDGNPSEIIAQKIYAQ